jgi:DNA replication protein DnaC
MREVAPVSSLAIEQIQQKMRQLKLVRTAEQLPLLLQDASKGEVAYSEFLAELFGRELAAKQERHTAMKTTMARFPFQKSLESFDFKFQPSIEPKVVRELATGRFLADADNVLLLGPPGRGQDPPGGSA